MKDTILSTLGVTLYVVGFGYLEFFGLYHAFNAHGNDGGVTAVLIPPLAWYRAVEFWWHDDFRGVDWGKRIDEDATLVAYLMNASYATDPETKKSSIEGVEFMKKRFDSYPNDRKRELEDLSLTYCEFMIAMGQELRGHFAEHAHEDSLPQFVPSFSLGKMVSKFETYPQLNDLVETNLDALKLMFKGDSPQRDDEEVQMLLGTIDLGFRRSARTMASTYESIFGKRPRFAPTYTPG